MADRFPSLEDFDSGGELHSPPVLPTGRKLIQRQIRKERLP
jgi:hypothetical protein